MDKIHNGTSVTLYKFTEKDYEVHEVLDFYAPIKNKVKPTKMYDGHEVNMSSQRFHLFKEKGTVCVQCKREGVKFKLQKNRNSPDTQKYHFGLWSEDNVQMTKDHIIPKSEGGKNNTENYQVMCELCNNEKSNKVNQGKK